MRFWRRPRRPSDEQCSEARKALAELDSRDAEVARLASRLRAAQRHNHFSELVNAAIERKAQGAT